MQLLLWLIAVVLVIAGIVQIARGALWLGVCLIVVGLLIGPGGVSVVDWDDHPDGAPALMALGAVMGFGRYAKAVVGAIVAGLGALKLAVDGGIDASEWIEVAIITLGALGAVWAIPNSPTVTTAVISKPGEPTTTVVSETE